MGMGQIVPHDHQARAIRKNKNLVHLHIHHFKTGCVVQSVTCLTTDAYLNADPGVTCSIQARSHTFMKIDHETISTVILLPSADSFKKGCCQ